MPQYHHGATLTTTGWYTPGGYRWYTLTGYRWYSIARSVTLARFARQSLGHLGENL